MDFGVLDGLVSSENHNKNTLISCCDLDPKPKWFGSGGGFGKQESPISALATGTREDEWRDLKMAKIGEDDISRRSNGAQNMLSFSSPNTQSVTFPYYARHNTVAGYVAGAGGPFTPSQWMELEHQALIYKYITANAAIPSNLLIPIRKALESAAFSAYSGAHLRQNSFGWGALHLGFCNSSDPEPGRCRRTDGKKWRCAKDAVVDQKYCERHMNRGRHRSRKPVEGQTCKLTTSTAVLRHTSSQPVTPNPAATSCEDNMSVVNKASFEATVVPMSSPTSVDLKKNDFSIGGTEFGFVCSDSLLNPMHKSDLKSQNPLHQFMEDSNQGQLCISASTNSDGFVSSATSPTSHSLLRMGLGMGKMTTNVQHDVSWETSMGGPLGEVLNTSPVGPARPKLDEGGLGTTIGLGHLL
ncbi:unnamed protein product [Lactuca saligna]|uniref:Growth-regulating factor n=1 Tax=Lactuca saligna TaxID=75948 RepID=A0AA36A4M9_LACSI|nr:unnamed protein product [Lactuca saligna]